MGDVVNLGNETNSARYISPKGALRDCLENDIGKRGAFKKGKKLVIIALDDTDGDYSVSYTQAGMRSSEMITVAYLFQRILAEGMGY